MKTKNMLAIGLAGASLMAGWALYDAQQPTIAHAADHAEAPGSSADQAADIADLYAWHSTADDTLTMVVTYAGLQQAAANQTAVYDADVVYGFHIDNTGDNTANTNIWVRFGQNSLGEWGVQVENMPGTTGPVVGAVGTMITAEGGGKVQTGLYDDPFFFDLAGYTNTLATGTLSFDGSDAFRGTNASAIVLEVPLTAAVAGATDIQVWSTTGRI